MAGDTGLAAAGCLVRGSKGTILTAPRGRMLQGTQASRWTATDLSPTRTLSHMPFLAQSLDWIVTGSDWVRERLYLLVNEPLPNTGKAGVY